MADLPGRMTAIAIREPGGPEVLAAEPRPLPVLQDAEVLVRVQAAGVNRPDVLQRRGLYPPPPGAPDIPGLEVAGEVAAVGRDVERWRLGDRVCALLPGGGYAEYAAVHESNALPWPEGLSAVEAAALPETTFTVWHNLFERGRLMEGESVLVHGGSSGIGTTAIQLARAFGAEVIATAGSPAKLEACRRLGAGTAVNYREGDWVAAVLAATGGRGVDLVLDMVGGSYLKANHEAAAVEGRIVTIAVQGGATAEIDLGRVMRKRLTLTGSTLRPRTVATKAAIARAVEERVWPLLAAGACRPVIHATVPLAEAAEAHRLMEEGSHIGKIVLSVG